MLNGYKNSSFKLKDKNHNLEKEWKIKDFGENDIIEKIVEIIFDKKIV